MKLIIDIPEEEYERLPYIDILKLRKYIENGTPTSINTGIRTASRLVVDVLDKIKEEIEQVEINGHIRDVECFRAGINTALDIIDKYKGDKE